MAVASRDDPPWRRAGRGSTRRRATRMAQRLLTALAVLALTVGVGLGWGAASAQDAVSPEGKRVAALFPGLVDDQSWNQAGYAGLQRLEEEGAEIAYTERVNQSQQ